jgi:hypothetical protein
MRVRPKRLDRRKIPRQLRFAQTGVNLLVANRMKKHRLAARAALEFRDQVMAALRHVRRYRPPA